VHPNEGWLELRLPTPLTHLSNTPGRAATYRLACPVTFTHRADEWAAQVATGAVRYDIEFNPGRNRWYLAASWRLPAISPPSLEQLRQDRALGVDLNADHLDAWVLDPSGNPIGPPRTIPLELDGFPASTRDGRLRAAISTILRLAADSGCQSILVENLDFADAAISAGRPSGGAGAASASAGPWRGSRPAGSAPCWSAWQPTTGCGSSPWILPGPRCGGDTTGNSPSSNRPSGRSPSAAITRQL
jgi:hypothetical protein